MCTTLKAPNILKISKFTLPLIDFKSVPLCANTFYTKALQKPMSNLDFCGYISDVPLIEHILKQNEVLVWCEESFFKCKGKCSNKRKKCQFFQGFFSEK